MESVVSNKPCVIWDDKNKVYAPRSWHYSSKKEWTPDIMKSRVFQNSAGAKNALRGAFGRYYSGPERKIAVLEFHKEFWRQEKKSQGG